MSNENRESSSEQTDSRGTSFDWTRAVAMALLFLVLMGAIFAVLVSFGVKDWADWDMALFLAVPGTALGFWIGGHDYSKSKLFGPARVTQNQN